MKKINILLVFVVILAVAGPSLAKGRKKDALKIPAGANVPSIGLAVDASYDPSTDGIVPGYNIISVAMTNNSIDILQMDKANDKWSIVDYKGKTHKAVANLKDVEPDLFVSLKPKLRKLLDYPMIIQVGETRVIDLLFKDTIKLDGFRAVKLLNPTTGKNLEIVAQD